MTVSSAAWSVGLMTIASTPFCMKFSTCVICVCAVELQSTTVHFQPFSLQLSSIAVHVSAHIVLASVITVTPMDISSSEPFFFVSLSPPPFEHPLITKHAANAAAINNDNFFFIFFLHHILIFRQARLFLLNTV